jgi:hypothetical protein
MNRLHFLLWNNFKTIEHGPQFQDHLTRITIKIQVVYEWFSTLYIMYSTAPHAMAHWNLKCVHAQTRLSFTETLFI